MKLPILAAGLLAMMLGTAAQADEKPTLTVYTYDSFASKWGPGPAVKTAFEKTCGCTLNFVTAGDGAALLSRLKLEGKRTRADVVIGLDTALTADAEKTGLFAKHGDLPALDLPVKWTDPTFVPFDWGWFAFVYDKAKVKEVPKSFEDLAKSKLKIVIEDPRSSTPGLGLLLWVQKAYGDKAPEIWKELADNIVTVTPGWSEAYNMFLKGEADMVLSYTTSPAYHMVEEKDDGKAAADFTEGNYAEVEVAGRIAGSKHPKLADEFMHFITTEAFQKEIPTTNWMYPVIKLSKPLPKGFDMYKPEKTLLYPAAEVPKVKDKALAAWRDALSK
ncbi:thiamine ABC transporter substrate binding subunit [Acidimangrovimonas sediminis]|uniref:thiamine ABC transporter substrate binding subunit n=1 Tax=Acidimangrovimonas sediminis TaxID=2056283 RepID=UPI000C80495E|nr:thiamine ABC transporter substrate binding subunit [Acidimangrovimonas sediminis]